MRCSKIHWKSIYTLRDLVSSNRHMPTRSIALDIPIVSTHQSTRSVVSIIQLLLTLTSTSVPP